MKRLVLWSLSGTLFCGCAPSVQQELPNEFMKKANSADGYYYHPTGAFSFRAPEIGYGLTIEERSTGSGYLVAFNDIYGGLVRVEVIECCDKEMEMISYDILKSSYPAVLRTIFLGMVMPPIERAFEVQYIREQIEQIDGVGQVYLALVNIPGASTLMDAATGKRGDSKRAYLVSLEDNQILVLSTQESPKGNQDLLNKLIELRKSYKKGNP